MSGEETQARAARLEAAADGLGLYVHVPFCAARCTYCDFYSTIDSAGVAGFIDALVAELRMRAPPVPRWETIYCGGGTPSLLSPQSLARLLAAVEAHGSVAPGAEVTIEVNPGTVTRASLRALREAGFARLSIGCQSFDDADLAFLGRIHTADEARAVVEDARAAGFDNVSLDLIHSLPGRTLAHWRRQMEAAVALAPEHLSCYALSAEPRTPLGHRVARGEVRLPSDALARRLYLETGDFLGARGYPRYEVSSHARSPELRAQHNLRYWRRAPYLGLGPSAHSFDGSVRRWNVASLRRWRAAITRGALAIAGEERVGPSEAALEELMLALRMDEGLDLDRYHASHGVDLLVTARDRVARLRSEGLIEIAGGRLRLTRAGMVVSDAVIAELAGD